MEVSILIFERADLKKIGTLKMETVKVRDMRKAWVSLKSQLQKLSGILTWQELAADISARIHKKASRTEKPNEKAAPCPQERLYLVAKYQARIFTAVQLTNVMDAAYPDPSYSCCSFFYRPVSREGMAENWQGQI